MKKRDELTDPSSCMSRARDDEWIFVLLGRDAAAPVAVRAWIEERVRIGKNKRGDAQILGAVQWIKTVLVGRPEGPKTEEFAPTVDDKLRDLHADMDTAEQAECKPWQAAIRRALKAEENCKQLRERFDKVDSYATGIETKLTGQLDYLFAAIKEHHDQKADDRCWEDDARLYKAAGLPPCDRRVGSKEAMLENCKRFIEKRCDNGYWPNYAELEKEIDRLRKLNESLTERVAQQSEVLTQRAEGSLP